MEKLNEMTVRERLLAAHNASTPAEALSELAKDADWYVRYAVAHNASTPAEVLAALAKDDDSWVRYAVAHLNR